MKRLTDIAATSACGGAILDLWKLREGRADGVTKHAIHAHESALVGKVVPGRAPPAAGNGSVAAVLALQRTAGNRAVAGMVPRLAVQRTVVPQAQIDGLLEDFDSANLPKAKKAIDELRTLKKVDGLSQLQSILSLATPQTQNDRNLVEYIRGYLITGAQGIVQKKMADLIRMFRAKQLQGAADPEQEETDTFRKAVAVNGMCGGWTVLFVQHPDWVEPVYNAVRTWVRPPGVSDSYALRHFELHLERTTVFDGVENVVELVRDAYEAMDVLEPTKYQEEPDWLMEANFGTEHDTSKTTDENARVDETVIRLKGRNAAHLVCAQIEELTRDDKELECMAHIESDIHHMAVRVQKLHPKGKTEKLRLIITVVESELQGMKKVVSWEQAEPLLNAWLSTHEPDLREITLRTRLVELNPQVADPVEV